VEETPLWALAPRAAPPRDPGATRDGPAQAFSPDGAHLLVGGRRWRLGEAPEVVDSAAAPPGVRRLITDEDITTVSWLPRGRGWSLAIEGRRARYTGPALAGDRAIAARQRGRAAIVWAAQGPAWWVDLEARRADMIFWPEGRIEAADLRGDVAVFAAGGALHAMRMQALDASTGGVGGANQAPTRDS